MTTIETAIPGRRIDICTTSIGPSLRITNTDTGRSINANLTGDEPHRIAEALSPAAAPTGGQWTRDDLPNEGELADLIRQALDGGIYEGKMLLPGHRLRAIIDMLAEWLNAHHPKPGPRPFQWGGVGPSEARQDADYWRGRFEMAERERDEAVARAEQAENARDTAATRAEQLERKATTAARAEADLRTENADLVRRRDEWKARAEQAERGLALAHNDLRREREERILDAAVTVEQRNTVADHLWNEMVGSAKSVVRDVVTQAFTAAGIETGIEAEAAEARTAPAVTRDEVEKAIRDGFDYGGTVGEVRQIADAVWALVSGSDPAVHVVRESDVAAVKVERTGEGRDWKSRSIGIPKFWTAAQARRFRDQSAGQWCEIEAIARAIEAEATVDPVEAEMAMAWAEYRKDYQPNPDDLTAAHKAFTSGYQAGRHVLGQEADDA